MTGHGRSWLSGSLLLCALQATLAFGQTAADTPSAGPALHDAQLADVCFVDAQRGWAVGDRGAIWHTADAGRHWQLQPSGVDCRLESVFFLDAENGWAAGGAADPYTATTAGVLLRTRDGGQSWARTARLLLPAFRAVKFFDARRGWAISKPSSLFPAGVFTTDDGGRSWTSLPPAETSGWLAGDFTSPTTGAVAGRGGVAAVLLRGNWAESKAAPLGLASARKLRFAGSSVAWMIGDGGTVQVSGDGGLSWSPPAGRLPEAIAQFDLAALAVRGRQCWIAGSPGTKVFHSADGGQTWSAYGTGQTLPLYGLAFADGSNGWAVGALGTILATTDGGRTWQRQQAGGVRAAVLGIYGDAADVPWELFARLAGNDGYLAAIEIVGRRDIESPRPQDLDTPERVQQALVAAGGSASRVAWAFPLRQAGLGLAAEQVIAPWDRTSGGAGLKQLEADLVRQIRVWRPEVVFTHGLGAGGDEALAGILQQAVLRAVQEAGQPTGFPEQIASAGLAPWRVKKVYGGTPPGRSATVNLPTAQLAPRLGRTLAEHAAVSRGLAGGAATAPDTLGFRLLTSDAADDSPGRDFLAGIAIQPGDGARRTAAQTSPEGVHTLERTAQKARVVQAILERANRDSAGGAAWLAEFDELTQGLDAASVATILSQMGRRYHQTGRWELAAETFELLATRYPTAPLARPALAWLVQYQASGEAAWRAQHAAGVALGAPPSAADAKRLARAVEVARRIEQGDPLFFAEPAVRFPLAAALRGQGQSQPAERYYQDLIHGGSQDAWCDCARAEQWLQEPRAKPPKSLWRCVRARAKPRLDGRLDDAVWQSAKPIELASAQRDDAAWPAVVMSAHDDEFLYLAVSCRLAPGAKYERSAAPRPRDPDLSGQDRVDLFFDLDRDRTTYYRLSIDHRGWTGEACWGDATWNPEWFVAAARSADAWTAEAAIPLAELLSQKPAAGAAWAAGAQRTVPGVGFQSWTTPASTAVQPEGFGLLIID